MYKRLLLYTLCFCIYFTGLAQTENTWIRINQLGYSLHAPKEAVLASKVSLTDLSFQLLDAATHDIVYKGSIGNSFGAYGPFQDTYRLQFTSFDKPGNYYLQYGKATSPVFRIDSKVYDGTADFCLRYMRQQRSSFNPFLKDSCHTRDGYTLYAPVPDSTYINVSGGWHDATDYLQYSTTSANATYHLLAAYRDFPAAFKDNQQANGLDGSNQIPDILDEAKWGLDWLLKMHPKDNWMFNQLGDDRDHKGMRMPTNETGLYSRGMERPVYFCSGQPQVRGKFMNNTTGVASTAGKFASAFALGSNLLKPFDKAYAGTLSTKALTAMKMGLAQPGACQTASVVTPYIYAEDNWTDDMELAAAALVQNKVSNNNVKFSLNMAYQYATQEPVTPWLGDDTAKHYQWYPFINIGHYELASLLKDKRKDSIIYDYKTGIERVWRKAKQNAFYRGIPFIWCSNNLTASFAIQCYWYRKLTQDDSYIRLEQACFDWLFGCNPWGTSMVYGLPSWGDTPADPHSSLSHLKHYPLDGGLVDGPVYTSIYSNLIGITLHDADEYETFQSSLAVYHDDYGDYSTNEPTMDGTASLIYLLASRENEAHRKEKLTFSHGAVVKADSSNKQVALVFTADELGDGLNTISQTLHQQAIKGSFFFTGRFYRDKNFQPAIKQLKKNGHYLGPHSNNHLLYCDWDKRDSLLVTKDSFVNDLHENKLAMIELGVDTNFRYYIPPYEWWNDTIALWSHEQGLQLINFSPGIRTNVDYTCPEMGDKYKSNAWIMASVKDMLQHNGNAFSGSIILIHAGTDARRKEKFYTQLGGLIKYLKNAGYTFKRVDELLED